MIDLAALLSAVKPKDRTDQYVILAAMFALDAHATSVTAKQIRDRLKLHLGAKIPANVNASLRAYAGYVSPMEEGPPIRWSLTTKGVERLRSLSGLSLSTVSDAESFNSDIGIICALEYPELAAVLKAFGGTGSWTEVGDTRHTHVYRETSLVSTGGAKLRTVAMTSTSMGLTAAAIATTQLVLEFRPRLVAMIGIAAGTRAPATNSLATF
jgi:hypothetical protein